MIPYEEIRTKYGIKFFHLIRLSLRENRVWTNFILHFLHIFTRRTIYCRLFNISQSGISHVQTYLINFQTRFSRKLNLKWNNLIPYFIFIFLYGITSCLFVHVIRSHPVYFEITSYQQKCINLKFVTSTRLRKAWLNEVKKKLRKNQIFLKRMKEDYACTINSFEDKTWFMLSRRAREY